MFDEGLKSLLLKTEYRSGEDDLINDFYIPCLLKSSLYRRAVGYFRSTIFLLVGEQVINFVRNGGKINIICSPHLTEEDIQAIKSGYENRSKVLYEMIDRELTELLENPKIYNRTRILATLVKGEALDFKIAFRNDSHGIYHEKLGIFIDKMGDFVTFRGSLNESWNAWCEDGNYEAFDVFCSWNTESDRKRASAHLNYFDFLWMNL